MKSSNKPNTKAPTPDAAALGKKYAALDKQYAARPAPARPAPVAAGARRAPLGGRLPYPGGFPVYLARYVLFGGEKPRVAMRFFNASEILITGLRLQVEEKDASGKTIAEYPLERGGLFAERGTEFAVADAPVKAACTSVEVRVKAVLSDEYEYDVEGSGVQLRYGVTPREHEYYFEKKPVYSVSRRRKRYVLLAFLSVLGTVILAGLIVWRVGALSDFGIDGNIGEAAVIQTVGERSTC